MCDTPHPDRRRRALLASVPAMLLLGLAPRARAAAPTALANLPAPGPGDTCPVCGMFVAKYPEWIATILYADGRALHFDGPKDFFKFVLEPDRYLPGYAGAPIAAMGVTEYYTLARIDARGAVYVLGSDTLGPMGHELVALETGADAADFMRDHAGKRQLGFDEVTPALLAGLDEGRFE